MLIISCTFSGDDLSKLKASNARRKAKSEIYNVPLHQATSEQLDIRAADAGIRVQRRSIKRVSLARLRKTEKVAWSNKLRFPADIKFLGSHTSIITLDSPNNEYLISLAVFCPLKSGFSSLEIFD